MSVAAFLVAGLVAFVLAFWLTRRLRHPRQAGEQRPRAGLRRRAPHRVMPSRYPPAAHPAADLDRQVRDLVSQGKLTDAVRRVRETNGCSLGDAKAYVAERRP
ncbi:MAG TPA: hypothetical protein VEZ50_21315 [Nodosilinea sp.]|nr:hypothetical protein [Nodosilinea sp.]